MTFTGKNTSFKAVWDCRLQSYSVYYKDKLIAIKYRFSDIRSYLN